MTVGPGPDIVNPGFSQAGFSFLFDQRVRYDAFRIISLLTELKRRNVFRLANILEGGAPPI